MGHLKFSYPAKLLILCLLITALSSVFFAGSVLSAEQERLPEEELLIKENKDEDIEKNMESNSSLKQENDSPDDNSPINEENQEPLEATVEQDKNSPEQAIYPGVINASIVQKSADAPSLEIFYPVFKNQNVNESIKAFAEKQAEYFKKEAGEEIESEEDKASRFGQWEMSGNFSLEYPNPDVVSVIFNIFSFTGGAHGNLEIFCLNYNLKTGKAIDFADLFKDPERALEIMSSFSAQNLLKELGEYADEDTIQSGTAPDLPNFANLSLIPDGLYIEFQPYQVGPWAAGPQRIKMTLQDLAAAGPEPDIWPNAVNLGHQENSASDISPAAGQNE